MSLWNFSHKPDSDWGEDGSSGKAVQPDHYPNVARPGGGYPESGNEESDTLCKTCQQNNLVKGRCPLCDWPNSVSEPIKNFPLDPFRDDKAGIRAGSTHSSSEDDYEWENPVAKGVKRWRDKALANFVMFIAEEIDTDMYETGFQPAFPEGWGNGLYESLHDGDYQRFKNIFEGCIEKYNEAMHKYNKEEVEDPSERIEYIDPDTDPKLVWNYFQKTIVGGRAQKKNKIPMGDRPHILYVITSPVAIKVGITGNGFKTRQQGYKQQNRKQFKNNPEWQWHTNPDELREIPIEGPGGQSTLFFDQQFSPQHLNQFYHTTPYGRNRKIVRSADEQGEIIHYVSPEMKKKTAEVIEARIINWCRDDCMIQTSPIGEQKGKTLPVIKNEQGEEEKVLHMCESIPMANSAGITPDLIAYFIGVMANNGGKAPDLGEYGKEWLQSNFNISDENFDQMFSGEFGQELGLNNQPEASSMLEQGQIQNQEINPNQQTLWNFNELSQEYPQAHPEGYTQEDVDDQESAMKWYELNGRNDKAGIRAGSWNLRKSVAKKTQKEWEDLIRGYNIEPVEGSAGEYKGGSIPVSVKGKTCDHEFIIKKPRDFTKNRNTSGLCPSCGHKERGKERKKEDKFLNDLKSFKLKLIEGEEYNNVLSPVQVLGACGHKFSIIPHNLRDRNKDGLCNNCANKARIQNLNITALTPEEQNIILELILKESQNGKYSPKQIAALFNKDSRVDRTITDTTVRNWVKKWKENPLSHGIAQEQIDDLQSLKVSEINNIIYLFQLGTEIKVGIAYDMPNRIKMYLNTKTEKRTIGNKRRINTNPNATPVKPAEEWTEFETNEQSNEELIQRGLKPITTGPKGTLPRGQDLRKDLKRWQRFDSKQHYLEWKENNQQLLNEFEKAIENNQFYFAELKNPHIASWIERYLTSFWDSLQLTPSDVITNYTETISVDPSKTKVASHLTFDFYKQLIEKLIENGGHIEKLNEVFTEEDITDLIKSGDFNSADDFRDVLDRGFLGSTPLGESLGIDFDAVEPNTGESVTYNFINQILQEKQIEEQNQQLSELTTPSPEQSVIPPVDTGSMIEPQTDLVAPQWNFAQPNEQIVPLTETELPQDIASQLPPEIMQAVSQGLAYPATDAAGNTTIIDANTDQIIWPNTFTAKTADHQGSTNWETWNTKVMIDNEYNLYMQSREMVKNFTPLNEFAIWATQAVIAPHNKQALEDAQEWNDIPYDERPTGREHMSEGGQALTEGFDEIFGMDPRADEIASIIDESKVDWPQIYNSIAEDIKESERFDHEEGKHDLLTQMYMTDFTAEELGNLQEETYPWCPICKVEHPDDPGDLTIPSDWTQ